MGVEPASLWTEIRKHGNNLAAPGRRPRAAIEVTVSIVLAWVGDGWFLIHKSGTHFAVHSIPDDVDGGLSKRTITRSIRQGL